jgi:hypothetical protein
LFLPGWIVKVTAPFDFIPAENPADFSRFHSRGSGNPFTRRASKGA